MSAEQLAARILSEASEVPSEQIRRGDMTEGEFRRFVEAAKALETCPLYIDDTPALPISQVAARARRLKRTHGLDVLIIDYLQLLKGSRPKDNRVQEVSEITQGLKAIAKELNIPVIALSQLAAAGGKPRGQAPAAVSDLRESGSIEQDADVVMFVFRDEYYKEREKPGDHELEKMAQWQAIDGIGARQGRGHHRQAAPRPDRHGGTVLRRPLHPLRQPREALAGQGGPDVGF